MAAAPIQPSLHELSRFVLMLWHNGNNRDDIVQVLVERGWPEQSAVNFVKTVIAEQKELSADVAPSTAAPVPQPEEEQDARPPVNSTGPASWKVVFLLVLMVALTIACMLSSIMH